MNLNNEKCVQLSTNIDTKTKAHQTDKSNQDSEFAQKSATNVIELSADAAKSTTIAMESSAEATESPIMTKESSANATESTTIVMESATIVMESSTNAMESATIVMESSEDTESLEYAAQSTMISMDTSVNAIESATIAKESSANATEPAETATGSTLNAMDTSVDASQCAMPTVASSVDATESVTIARESSSDATESAKTATESSLNAMDTSVDASQCAMPTVASSVDATESVTIARESSADATESSQTASISNTIARESSADATESVTNAINTSTDSMEVEISGDNSISDKQEPKIIDSPKSSIKDPNQVLNDSKLNPLQSLYGKDGIQGFHDIPRKYITPPIIPKKLPVVFKKFLPIFQLSNNKDDEDDTKKVLKEFVGSGLGDEMFDKLEMYCSIEHLKSGLDAQLTLPFPIFTNRNKVSQLCAITDEGKQLNTVVKTNLRNNMDKAHRFRNGLAYRGVRFADLQEEKDVPDNQGPAEPPLVPGKDLIFKIRIYKPFPYNPKKKIETVSRHPILSHDLILHGRQSLEVIREQFRCNNDLGLRVDVSNQPHQPTPSVTSCRELFPSAFLFINNVFYDDRRPGCKKNSSVIREWAAERGLGVFPAKRLNGVLLHDLEIRLGYPEVFVHQGDCEHLFTFSQVRLVGPNDVLDPSQYPKHRILSNNHGVYCTTCAEFVAKWIVVGTDRTPFDPAFFCDTCFHLYMYKDDKKIGNFKAYQYVANDASNR